MSDRAVDRTQTIVLSILSQRDVVEEPLLIRSCVAYDASLDAEQVKSACNDLHSRNMIRWVAFRGWALGGRPL